jgi:hypothetical protein
VAESDFDALDIRLGDRRKLQREIARRQFWPENSPLPTPDELRQFTLSLQANNTEESKSGFRSHVSEALDSERISPDLADSPAHSNVQDERLASVSETSKSSDTIPPLELDAEVDAEACGTNEGGEYNHPSVAEANFDDDDTPRALENRGVSFTWPREGRMY